MPDTPSLLQLLMDEAAGRIEPDEETKVASAALPDEPTATGDSLLDELDAAIKTAEAEIAKSDIVDKTTGSEGEGKNSSGPMPDAKAKVEIIDTGSSTETPGQGTEAAAQTSADGLESAPTAAENPGGSTITAGVPAPGAHAAATEATGKTEAGVAPPPAPGMGNKTATLSPAARQIEADLVENYFAQKSLQDTGALTEKLAAVRKNLAARLG